VNAPADVLEVFLQPGEFYFGENKTRIRTLLGSCVAITLWHPKLEVGGMCHYMLPRRPRRKGWETEPLDGRYAEDAMKLFLREIHRTRTRAAEFQVKLFGGGQMFRAANPLEKRQTIAQANIEFGRAAIAQCGFKLSAENLGGNGHRNVILDVWSGDVWVRQTEPKATRLRAHG
jgi:chemotaxis protein CheD